MGMKRRSGDRCWVVLMVFLVFAISIPYSPGAAASNGKIVIGMIEALSGPFKATGDRMAIGARYAVDTVNARGGVLGKEVVLITEDSQVKADVATRKVTKLILEDKADAIIFGLGSNVALAGMKVAEKYKKIFVVYGSEAASITGEDFNPYVFRTILETKGGRPAAVMTYFAKYAKFKKFYILCQDFSLGREAAEGFKRKFKTIPGAQLLGEDYHPIGLKDFSPYVSKIIASGAEVVLTGNYGNDLTNLIKTASSLGFKGIMGCCYLGDPVVLQDVNEAAIGYVTANAQLWDMNNPKDKKFINDFFEKYPTLDRVKFSPVYGITTTYYGVKWLLDVMEKVGSTDSEKIIKGWEGMNYEMPSKVTMRACDHQLIQPVMVAVIERKNDLFPFPFTGKPIVIPEEEVTVPPAETGNSRCR